VSKCLSQGGRDSPDAFDDRDVAQNKDGRYADPIVDWSTELEDPAVQSELQSALALPKSRAHRARLLRRRRLAVFMAGAPSAVEMAS
jgi:hypothetical protein